jgi:uncharacterized protein DUF6544
LGFRSGFINQVAQLRPLAAAHTPNVTEAELTLLPHAARSYIVRVGSLGRPRLWSFLVHRVGHLKRGERYGWERCEAWQYSMNVGVARIMHVKLWARGLVPVVQRSVYESGRGSTLTRMLDRFHPEAGSGFLYDAGELAMYLNDAILFAPSMLLVPEASWRQSDEMSFEVTFQDGRNRASTRVLLDGRGVLRSVRTLALPSEPLHSSGLRLGGGMTVAVDSWVPSSDRLVPSVGKVIWSLGNGDFCHAQFRTVLKDSKFNAHPLG